MTGDGGRSFQRQVSRELTEGLEGSGFALAGSGAVREYGLIDRPTEDIDLFTTRESVGDFKDAVAQGVALLERQGYGIRFAPGIPVSDSFARLTVTLDGETTDLDMCIDWRAYKPVRLDDVGYILEIEDAVANKIDAVVSRGEARDYCDAVSIRKSGRFADAELYRIAAEHDPTFTPELFARALDASGGMLDTSFAPYVTRAQLQEFRTYLADWAQSAHEAGRPASDESSSSGMVHVRAHTRDGHAVREYWRRR